MVISSAKLVKLAKVDATVEKKAAEEYQVQGFPTLHFFLNGKQMDYTGQRSKESMLNWLLKKTRDPVVQIDKEAYEKLASASSVSIVYHGDFSSAEGASILNELALADDYNSKRYDYLAYYWGADLGKEAGTVELVRSFDACVTYTGIDDGLQAWISRNERSIVVPFDERTIQDVFGQAKTALVLFNGANSNVLLTSFQEAAQQYSSTDGPAMIFTEINAENEHLANFADYIKIKHEKSPVVLIKAKDQVKYVMKGEATTENILAFISNY